MTRRLVPALLLLLLAPAVTLAADGPTITTKLLSPVAGATLVGGDKVLVQWQVDIPPKTPNLKLCEQELLLSVDGGKTNTLHVTPILTPGVRSYSWRVPDVETEAAVIDLRFNCGGFEFPMWMPWAPQTASTFRIIKGPGTISGVDLAPLPAAVVPGSDLRLRWESDVKGVLEYEIRVSFDEGNRFATVGRTKTTSFSWAVPDTWGGVTFQVVAHTADGGTYESLVPTTPQTHIGVPK